MRGPLEGGSMPGTTGAFGRGMGDQIVSGGVNSGGGRWGDLRAVAGGGEGEGGWFWRSCSLPS